MIGSFSPGTANVTTYKGRLILNRELVITYKMNTLMWLMTKYFTHVGLIESSRETKIKDSRFIWAPFIYKILIFLILLPVGKGQACYGLKKTKHSNSIPRYISKRTKNRYLNKYLYTNIHNSIIHNSQKVGKKPKCSSRDKWKNTIWYPSKGLFSSMKRK